MIKYLEFKIFVGKYLPPFHEIFVQEIPLQKCFAQNFFICELISKIFAAHFATN